jgi:hypothetical protein
MEKTNNFLSAIKIQVGFVRPHWGRRFVAMSIATNIGLRRSPTDMCYKLENIEANIQKGLTELKKMCNIIPKG